ncbi:MAG: ABC transporter substrate-binding protein [Armatimonadota bacterium]
MKKTFVGILCMLILLSVAAWKLQPKQVELGKTSIVWTSDDNPVRRAQIDLFNKLHPKDNLVLDPSNSDMSKVIVQSLAGVGPDLFDCYTPTMLSAYVKSGIAWDVTDELKKAGIDVRKDVWSATLPLIVYEGRVYGFPTNAAADAIWYNKDIFDKQHIPYPSGSWTWDQFIKLAQKLTIRDASGRAKQYGLICDLILWEPFVYQYGGRLFTKDGTRCVIDSPEAVAGIQLMHDLIYKYHICPSPQEASAMATSGGWGSGAVTQFGGGKGAMAIGGRYWLCSLRSNKDLRLGAVEMPHGPRRVFYGYGRATLINKNSPKRYEALKFLLYLAGKEYNELVNDQADAIAPVIKYCYTDKYLYNPRYPQEDFNAVWRDVMKDALPGEASLFINGQVVDRVIRKQLDLVKNNQKSAAAAMKTAASQINAEIAKNIAEDPALKKQYDELTSKAKGGTYHAN